MSTVNEPTVSTSPFVLEEHNFFFRGRVALYAILKALDLKENDEVILPGYTCVVVPSAISFSGAKPVYVDIDPGNYNLDLKAVERAITPNTKVIIVQHTYGIPLEMESIREMCEEKGIFIIEDCAHSLGARYKGGLTGTLGDAAFFSTQWNKPFTTGMGGLAVCSNDKINKSLAKVASSFTMPGFWYRNILSAQYLAYKVLFSPSRFWMLMKAYRAMSKLGLIVGSAEKKEFKMEQPDNYEMRMGPYQVKLVKKFFGKQKEIEKMIAHRKLITGIYENRLRNEGFRLPVCPDTAEAVFLRYPVPVKNKKEVMKLAKVQQVELGDWFYSPLHPFTENLDVLGYHWGMCPRGETAAKEVINLPTHLDVDSREAERILNFVVAHARPAD